MAFTHTVGVVYKTDAGTITNTTDSYTEEAEVDWDGAVATATTNHEVDLAFGFAAIRSLVLYSTAAITIKTNSTSSPGDTITLVAGKQRVWNTDHSEANPFTADVTKLYITNATLVTANIKLRFLLNLP